MLPPPPGPLAAGSAPHGGCEQAPVVRTVNDNVCGRRREAKRTCNLLFLQVQQISGRRHGGRAVLLSDDIAVMKSGKTRKRSTAEDDSAQRRESPLLSPVSSYYILSGFNVQYVLALNPWCRVYVYMDIASTTVGFVFVLYERTLSAVH